MRVLNLTIAALLVLSLATPAAAQQYRTLSGEPGAIYNPANCGKAPEAPAGAIMNLIMEETATGPKCTWTIQAFEDPKAAKARAREEKRRLQQERAQAYAQERARADAQVRECALGLVARYNMYLHDAKLACMGAAPMPYGYSYGGGYAGPRYRDPSNPFH